MGQFAGMTIIQILVTLALILFALWAITLCLRIGAGWSGVPKSENTIGRALLAMILSWLVVGLLGGGGTFLVPVMGNLVGLLIALLINGAIIAAVYGVKFGKGIQIYLLAIVAQVLLTVLAVFILGLLGLSLA